MTASEAIQASLKALLRTAPLQDISVEDICRGAFVSRKTFYLHYSSKFDLVDKIFQQDIIHSTADLRKLLPANSQETAILVLERFYQGFYDNKEFYAALLAGKGRYWFREQLLAHLESMNLERTLEYERQLPKLEREYMSYFFAAANTMLLIKWLTENCPLSPRSMAEYYNKWAITYWLTLDEQTLLPD